MAAGSGLYWGSMPKALSLEALDLSFETGNAISGIGTLLLNDGGGVALLVGLVLLFAMLGPSLAWG